MVLHISDSEADFFSGIGYVNGDRTLAVKVLFFYFNLQEAICNIVEEDAFSSGVFFFFLSLLEDFINVFKGFAAIFKLRGNHLLHRNIIVEGQENF